ncbi:MAG: DNA topoisomerase 4 subunit A [Clostridia bacterium]|nr:DNA topoisomerase 4 subunit A [Clostridia bacterium]
MARKKSNTPPEDTTPQYEIIQKSMDEVMHISMIPYAEHVILERALPRVEDGLKPVQRRILFTLHELGVTPDKPHKKCARIVGDCLGKYHPHGDSSVYDAMVRMAQPYSLRGLLVDGHGNFGSIDGDSAAAMRYTEARMAPLALEMLRDLEKDTVPFSFNFDDTLKEPDILPSRYPNLLVNGASGIAVGLATNIPPHNLREAINATILVMDKPEATLDEIMAVMPAPDFPTGGCLINNEEIRTAYETGRGKLTLRSRVHIEEGTGGRKLIVITEVPYGVPKAGMLEKILHLSEEKKSQLSGIYDIRDESDREGLRAVIELRKDVNPDQILSVLYKYSDLQITYGVNLVAIAEGRPMQLGIKAAIEYYIKHQENVVTRRTQYELDQARAREHILAGLMVAVNNLDEVIRLIRASKTPKEAKAQLTSKFDLDDVQAQAILDLRLQRLTGLELETLRKEYEDILKTIARLEGILKSEKKLKAVIKKEMEEVRDQFSDERRTTLIEDDSASLPVPDIKQIAEDMVLLRYKDGQIRRVAPKLAEKMLAQPEIKSDILTSIMTSTDETAYFFTNLGNCFSMDIPKIPETTKPKERGIQLSGLIQGLENHERAVAVYCFKSEDKEASQDFVFVTKNGLLKRTGVSEYIIRRSRFVSMKLKEGDEILSIHKIPSEDKGDFLLFSKDGFALRLPIPSIPTNGRMTAGVKGMGLESKDTVIKAMKPSSASSVFLITERGFGKRLLCADIERSERGRRGQRMIMITKSGEIGTYIAGLLPCEDIEHLKIHQAHGSVTEISLDEVPVERRTTRGRMLIPVLLDDVITLVEDE